MVHDHILTVTFGAKFSQIVVVLLLKRIHYYQRRLLFWVCHIFFDLIQSWKGYFLKILSGLQLIWPVVFGVRDVKLRGISTFDKHLLVFTEYISCVGRRFPVALTVNVAVICLLSSTPFIRAFFAPFQLMCIFQEARKKGGQIKVDNQITWT